MSAIPSKDAFLSALREYAASLSVSSSLANLGKALNSAAFVKYALEEATLTTSDMRRERLAALIPLLNGLDLLGQDAIVEGVRLAVDRLPDMAADNPQAFYFLGTALAWLSVEGVVPESEGETLFKGKGPSVDALAGAVEAFLSGSAFVAPLPLLQLRKAFGEVVELFVRSGFCADSLVAAVASLHCRQATPQLQRKVLQKALSLPAGSQEVRFLAEAFADSLPRVLSKEEATAGVASFLRDLPVSLSALEIFGKERQAAAVRNAALVVGECLKKGLLNLPSGAGFYAEPLAALLAEEAKKHAAAAAVEEGGASSGALSPSSLSALRSSVSGIFSSFASTPADDDASLQRLGDEFSSSSSSSAAAAIVAVAQLYDAAAKAGSSSSGSEQLARLSQAAVFLAHSRHASPEALVGGSRAYFSRVSVATASSSSETAAAAVSGAVRVLETLLRAGAVPQSTLAQVMRDAAVSADIVVVASSSSSSSSSSSASIAGSDDGAPSALEASLKALKERLPRVRGEA